MAFTNITKGLPTLQQIFWGEMSLPSYKNDDLKTEQITRRFGLFFDSKAIGPEVMVNTLGGWQSTQCKFTK